MMIKRLLIIFVIALLIMAVFPLTSPAKAEEINWYSYDEGISKAKSEGKPIFIDFWSNSCGPCVRMEEEVYPNEEVIQKSKEFINIKVDVYQDTEIATDYEIRSIPTLIFLNSEGDIIRREKGYKSSTDLTNMMDDVLDSVSDGNGEDNDDRSLSNDANSEDKPFWKDLIFIEIVVSIFIAIGIILFIRKTKEEESV